jgi:hypothetical protein
MGLSSSSAHCGNIDLLVFGRGSIFFAVNVPLLFK